MATNPGIDSTPKSANAPVKSGSGTKSSTSVNAEAIAAGDFAYGQLGSGTAGGMGNAALLSTTTILPNTKRTQVSKAQLVAADKNYTTQMNLLSQHWAVGDTSSPSYAAQKQAAMSSQYSWELARNNLEEVATDESSNIAPITSFDNADLNVPAPTAIDLSGNGLDLTQPDGQAVDGPDIEVTGKTTDQRIRLRPKERGGNGQFPFFGDESSVLYQLNETNGVFFPYTPVITYQHKAAYTEMTPTHANTSYHTYNNTPAVQIQIEGQFSAQNLAEAKYTLAAMHFFRSATKMHFGMTDENAGLPPPLLILSGYGEFMFNELSVILTDFSMALPNNVDYLEVDIGGHSAWVPSLTTFSISCVVQQTPKQQREEFNLGSFASGSLLSKKGWI